MADVLEIKNTVIEHFTGDMPIDWRQELNAVENYLASLVLKYNLEVLKILSIQAEKRIKKWWFNGWVILERS
jgi:hypothetical protein